MPREAFGLRRLTAAFARRGTSTGGNQPLFVNDMIPLCFPAIRHFEIAGQMTADHELVKALLLSQIWATIIFGKIGARGAA